MTTASALLAAAIGAPLALLLLSLRAEPARRRMRDVLALAPVPALVAAVWPTGDRRSSWAMRGSR